MSDESTGPSVGHLWYVRREAVTNGPFPTGAIKRYVVLGRIRPTDEVSRDRVEWRAVSREPAFSAIVNSPPDPVALAHADERTGDRRGRTNHGEARRERRHESDRREDEAQEVVVRRARRARVMASVAPRPVRTAGPLLFTTLVAVLIAAGGYVWRPSPGDAGPDCTRAAAPRVDWSGCDLQGADLDSTDLSAASLHNARLAGARAMNARLGEADIAYADLSRANFGYANLGRANLRGVSARGADFAYAILAGADLSYADLRGAALGGANLQGTRLDRALWIDGRTCAVGSVGACL